MTDIVDRLRDTAAEIERLRQHLSDCCDELEREDARMPHRRRVAGLARRAMKSMEGLETQKNK